MKQVQLTIEAQTKDLLAETLTSAVVAAENMGLVLTFGATWIRGDGVFEVKATLGEPIQ